MSLKPLSISLTRLEKPGRKHRRSAVMEFHISRKAREHYGFDDSLFSLSGNVIFANFLATRIFAKKMNDKRDIARNPEKAVLPGQLNAMGLIDEILHYVAELYREEKGPNLFGRALEYLEKKLGKKDTDEVLLQFAQGFPNVDVHQGRLSPQDFLAGQSDGVSHREMVMEEVLLLWLANMNPAFGPYQELFEERELRVSSRYDDFIEGLKEFFGTMPAFGPDSQTLVDMLRAPAIAVPYSLYGQLQYMKDRWGLLLGKFLMRLLSSLDFMKEEERLFWKGGGLKSEGYDSSLNYGGIEHEPERFSDDKEWMPKVILLAKSTLVWLDQLTKKYKRNITTLDQIPDEELDQMANRGFNALWLIGLWERSKASKRIKQMCGNPEAEASAYSLYDYDIAGELGGWNALNNLRERAWKRGIRLASDMVPNHTSMDSRWISEHPDWFLQLDYCPYPQYSFSGVDLSQDSNIEVKLEDHYYDRTDAAVVFMHRDKNSNRVRFIYHGNDGTSMPWNDTAQINYLNAEAREAIIKVILHVAQNFPIIRFDAAMTLAKKHIQRLWFPLPGSGGDIATRAEHGLSRADFDKAIPEEFWREVVDRVAREVPDTLLLAEAFWMMEGYFVRTLGMHRVYNSAFMHMLKKEENEKYRYTIKNTIEFDPDILKRFVNFMNNPDEETAAVQFGTGDKYFGVATMMMTMPGTPMVGHGQVEGFREKYGMEYRRAYWNEQDDQGLIERHEREIFPLMHRRHLFAEVRNFFLYDLWTPQGFVNQNVFAYSNGNGQEHALILYNNSYEKAAGWIKTSAGYAVKKGDGTKEIRQKDLGPALGLTAGPRHYVILKEQNSGLWFIRKSQDLVGSGMYVELNGYGKQVFWDIHEVEDSQESHFARLCTELNGRGVSDVQEALKDMTHRALYQGFYESFSASNFRLLYEAAWERRPVDEPFWAGQEARLASFFWRVKDFAGVTLDPKKAVSAAMADLKSVFRLAGLTAAFQDRTSLIKPLGYLDTKIREPALILHVFFAKALLGRLGELIDPQQKNENTLSLIEEWYLDRKVQRIFGELGATAGEAHHMAAMVKLLIGKQGWLDSRKTKKVLLTELLTGQDVHKLLGVHRYDGVIYFHKEGLDYYLWWIFAQGLQDLLCCQDDPVLLTEEIRNLFVMVESWGQDAEKAGYRLDDFLSEKPTKKTGTKKATGMPEASPEKVSEPVKKKTSRKKE